MKPEVEQAASGGRDAARAMARLLALSARRLLLDAEDILRASGDEITVETAKQAGEATTQLLRETHDGPNQVFACSRGAQMPWRGKQAQAIFLKKRREVGEAGARRFMHAHGNSSARSEAVKAELKRRNKKARH